MHRYVTMALMGLVGTAAAAAAQKQPEKGEGGSERQGFFFNIGLGAGSIGIECNPCGGSSERETGFSGGLSLGGTVSPSVLIGVGTNGWYKQETVFGTTFTSTAGWITGQVLLYPSRQAGFFIRIGLGFMLSSVEVSGVGELTSRGPGALLGAGYDIPVGRTVSLTPYVNFLGSQGNLEIDGFEILNEDFNPNLAQFGLALSVH